MKQQESDVPGSLTASEAAPALEDPRVIAAVREYLAALEAGHEPDRGEFLARHAAIAEALAVCLEGLEFVHQAASGLHASAARPTAADTEVALGTPLGDFRLVREVGRGGMGVVYEAEQLSLKRRVAVKVLPFAAALDTRQLQRFRHEAEAAALLHHTNIVPVLCVGCDRGVHFYAMQFIDGQTLAALIRALARPEPRAAAAGAPTPPLAALSTEYSAGGPAFFRTVANLGVQAAEALEHAHQLGVVHRDVKPANLLVDGRGNLWVTDFGLARFPNDTGLTLTGDLLGTLRYMSPEQALARPGAVDHRTDIYSLGVTLYELLTLQPACDGRDRQEVLRQIEWEEPRPPRRLNPAIPAELETVVLKALAKEPEGRYATAQELADDLQRFLDDKPIRARRPTLVQRAKKWGRRHKPIVASVLISTLVVLGLFVLALAVSNAQVNEALRHETRAKEDLARALEREQQTSYFQRIASAAQQLAANNLGRAEELLDECVPSPGQPDLRGWEWHYLKRRRYEQPRELPHAKAVMCVAYSPDGRYLASGCLDGSVTVWDRRTGQRLPNWNDGPEAHRAHVYGLAFSPDSRYLAAGGTDRRILVWELDGTVRHRFEGHADTITQLAFRPDGRRLASASEDGTVRLWDLKTGQEGLTFREHQNAVRGLAFSAEGQLISAGADGCVKVWDPGTGAVAATFRGRTRWVSALAFHADSKRLALASWDGSIELWDALGSSHASAKETRTLHGHTAQILSLAFSPDGCRLVSAGDDKLLKLWDARTGHEAITLDLGLRVAIGVAFSPDGHELACGCSDPGPVVKLWDGTPLPSKEVNDPALSVIRHDEPVVRVAFSPDGKFLASASRDGTAKIWNATTGREMFTVRGHNAIVCAVAFSPDGQRVASGSWDGNVLIWNASSGQVVYTLCGQADFVFDVAFSPDGKYLASAHSNGRVVLWDPDAGKELRRIRAHKVETAGLAFSPDSNLLATAGGRDLTAKLWTLATGEERAALPEVTSRVHAVAFSPDGLSVAAAQGRYLTVWDAANGNLVRPKELAAESGRVCHLAFSRDGRWLATAGWDQTVRLWDVRTGQQVALLRGHAGPVLGVAFSLDGRLASCGGYRGKGEIKIWDAALWEKNRAESRER